MCDERRIHFAKVQTGCGTLVSPYARLSVRRSDVPALTLRFVLLDRLGAPAWWGAHVANYVQSTGVEAALWALMAGARTAVWNVTLTKHAPGYRVTLTGVRRRNYMTEAGWRELVFARMVAKL